MATDDDLSGDEKRIDKNKIAVALTYEPEKNDAPRLSAKGKGHIAQAIIDLARQNGIEVRQDADLAQLLSKLDIDMPIPLEAYAAVAEIISYIYRANDKARKHV